MAIIFTNIMAMAIACDYAYWLWLLIIFHWLWLLIIYYCLWLFTIRLYGYGFYDYGL
jgi:hypothetical protein